MFCYLQVLLELTGSRMESPEFPEEIHSWNKYNELSSEKLYKKTS